MKKEEYRLLLLFVLTSRVLSVTPLEEETFDTPFENFLEPIQNLNTKHGRTISVKYSLRKPSDPDTDICYIVTGNPESIGDCSFNITARTFLVIHGWTVSGMFEGWVSKLVAALFEREPAANVIVVDWLSTAQNHYIVAAQSTKMVGKNVAHFINWMEEMKILPLENLHLIGYSLGAHVAGFAGSHVSNKVGRITGLDPAGPDFEGTEAHLRLSPDDARFVDVLHTFNCNSLGLSIGIQQPVGHVDIYPNGGSFQPGCNLHRALGKIASYGILAISEAMKCEHERSVQLFIDSLLNRGTVSQAYSCSSSDMFDRGVCLSCRRNRCSMVGYDARKSRRPRSTTMFTRTRASMPFRVYHYQLKIVFLSKANRSDLRPTLSVSLRGLDGETEDLPLNVCVSCSSVLCHILRLFAQTPCRKEKILVNRTHSFLVVTERDIGELLMVKFKWEDASGWSSSSLLQMLSSWRSDTASASDIEVHKIRVKVGETQKRMVFCPKNPETLGLSQELTFVKCKDGWNSTSKRHVTKRP